MKYINNKDVPYSPGNSIQYLIITYNGKESEKENMHVCLYNSPLLYTRNIKSTIFQFKTKKNCAVRSKIMEERLEEMWGKNNFLMGDFKPHLCSAGNELV